MSVLKEMSGIEMKNYKMIIQYDGTRYYGWQRQPDKLTVQGVLEKVLGIMCEREVELIGAGRTDGGVHAKGMAANVFLDTGWTSTQIREYLNANLPQDIAVKEVREAAKGFHARYNAVGKTYCYTCHVTQPHPVFDRRYYYALEESPNLEKMLAAAGILKGNHDYQNFCTDYMMKKSTVRVVDRIDIIWEGGYLRFIFHGSGFMRNMVRIMVGTLLEIGYNRKSLEELRELLNPEEYRKAGPTVPAQGLCLIEVEYN